MESGRVCRMKIICGSIGPFIDKECEVTENEYFKIIVKEPKDELDR